MLRRATMRGTTAGVEPPSQGPLWQGPSQRDRGVGMVSSPTSSDTPLPGHAATRVSPVRRQDARRGQAARGVATTRHDEHTALMARIAQGDQSALTALYEATNALVYGLAWRIVHEQSAAEDVTLEVYTQVYQQASRYDASRGTPTTWLLTLARSRAIDRLRVESLYRQRAASLDRALGLPSAEPDPEVSSTATQLQRVVRTALTALSPAQQHVIALAYYAGCSHNEIAATLGQPLGTVKTRLRTAMMALRHRLGPLLEEDRS